MKRFLLFQFNDVFSSGGMNDLEECFNTIDELKEYVHKTIKEKCNNLLYFEYLDLYTGEAYSTTNQQFIFKKRNEIFKNNNENNDKRFILL